MHEFLHQQNLIRYRKLLTETTDELQRHQLLKLLAEEEAYEHKQRWSHFPRQPAEVGSPMPCTNHHDDTEMVFG